MSVPGEIELVLGLGEGTTILVVHAPLHALSRSKSRQLNLGVLPVRTRASHRLAVGTGAGGSGTEGSVIDGISVVGAEGGVDGERAIVIGAGHDDGWEAWNIQIAKRESRNEAMRRIAKRNVSSK